jgi:hypothetical protein
MNMEMKTMIVILIKMVIIMAKNAYIDKLLITNVFHVITE